jgi:hypothetical protein
MLPRRCLRLVEQVIEPRRLLLNEALRRGALVVPVDVAMSVVVVRCASWTGNQAVVGVRRRRRNREGAARRQQCLLLELPVRHHLAVHQAA